MASADVTARSTEQLLRLLAQHQEDLQRYVFALVPHQEDVKDILQDTYVALTRKFADYDFAKPFLPWAYGFAYVEVLKHRDRSRKSARTFGDEVVEMLARERELQAAMLDDRLTALDHCLEKLPQADRLLISHRYLSRTTIEQLVDIAGSSRRTLFRNLERIRRLLFDCISHRVEEYGVEERCG
ncbi:MAG: sigma-70 family RNA polymerase sigma factor [Planctomycetales bacterium]|nr:sigma-70 family RNA polymerase sigma factor [Planctomycetales bacterium]MBN8628697.1 sigma-70 family RNA polymerase sigma factor [Planctomycetota bacterium]